LVLVNSEILAIHFEKMGNQVFTWFYIISCLVGAVRAGLPEAENYLNSAISLAQSGKMKEVSHF
jgi:hypothetical protein